MIAMVPTADTQTRNQGGFANNFWVQTAALVIIVAVLVEAVLPHSGILPRRLSRHCGASVVTARDAVANRTEIPMKLTDTQLVLLSAASQREEGGIELAPNLKDAAARKV